MISKDQYQLTVLRPALEAYSYWLMIDSILCEECWLVTPTAPSSTKLCVAVAGPDVVLVENVLEVSFRKSDFRKVFFK